MATSINHTYPPQYTSYFALRNSQFFGVPPSPEQLQVQHCSGLRRRAFRCKSSSRQGRDCGLSASIPNAAVLACRDGVGSFLVKVPKAPTVPPGRVPRRYCFATHQMSLTGQNSQMRRLTWVSNRRLVREDSGLFTSYFALRTSLSPVARSKFPH
jgi:hypothetical protein